MNVYEKDMNRFFWMLKHNALMVVYIVAAFAILAIITALFWIYKTLCKNRVCDSNNTRLGMSQGLIKFSIEELKQATNNFGESNLIGSGSFGPVYNGLIRNTIVAIKKLSGSLRPRFLAEVTYLSTIRHRNVVNIFGYCCENEQQMIVYEYLVNGSLRDHLHDLNFKKRISIALGAAKGLLHLHSLTPPLTHNRFKTAKVLLDANFNPKVSNAGLSREEEEEADGHDPEVGLDVYSFGLFLLELLTGEEPKALTSNDELIQWVKVEIEPRICANTFVDKRINGTFTREALKSVMKIMLKCLKFPAIKRPKMEEVVTELGVYQKDLTSEEDGSTKFTLGSELFTMIA